ncbi:hypothetical protein BCD67_03095 [Oscillatoriales cyanobacterium USR001]|nr:hypothetical protein BCD67_03095 [Oscillatoriales cyanobacterium USR001]
MVNNYQLHQKMTNQEDNQEKRQPAGMDLLSELSESDLAVVVGGAGADDEKEAERESEENPDYKDPEEKTPTPTTPTPQP